MTGAEGSLIEASAPRRTSVGRVLWLVAGLAAMGLGLGWVVWWSPHPLLVVDGVSVTTSCWLSPPVYGAALLAWGCFRQAGPRGGSRTRSHREAGPSNGLGEVREKISGRRTP